MGNAFANLCQEFAYKTGMAVPPPPVPPLRPLENPVARVNWPTELGFSAVYTESRQLQRMVERSLRLYGHTSESIRQINVAFPQKHPWKNHENKALDDAGVLAASLRKLYPRLKIAVARGLFEEHHLRRSEDQSALHALTDHQFYSVDMRQQTDPMPFFERTPTDDAPDFFVLTDWIVEQGTTLVNLGSYIQHNGGKILGLATQWQTVALAPRQRDHAELAGALAKAATAAGRDYKGGEIYALLDLALKPFGRTLGGLASGEMRALGEDAVKHGWDALLLGLDVDPQAEAVMISRHRARPAAPASALARLDPPAFLP